MASVGISSSFAELENDDNDLGSFIAPAPWQEEGIVIPAFPENENLIKVDIDQVDTRFDFYIDSKNLAVSSKDGVTRYTVVIESDSGAKNVIFEGLRCSTGEYRTYAYGTYDKKFVKAQASEWALVRDGDRMVYRYNFYRHYLCGDYSFQNPLDVVIQKIKYPAEFSGSGDFND